MEIRLEGVTKYYFDDGKSTKGIEGVSLDFRTDGSFVVITGESGAGKSTLIKILTGLEDFDEGEIFFDGTPLSGMSQKQRQELYQKNISFVFQDYNLVESLTAEQNITIALLKQGFNRKEASLKAQEALKEVGLEAQMKMTASRLSGGERQRVAIARSLALDTKVIIFDEPTGNLDQGTSRNIIDLIEKVKRDRLIIYVTHEYQQVEQYVTRHIVLADGAVIKDEKIKEPGPIEEKEKNKTPEGKFSFKSQLFASSLFCFSRPGRFIATLIVIILSCVSILSSALLYTGFLISASSIDTLITGYSNDSGTMSLTVPLGNRVDVKKSTYDETDFVPASSDYIVDKGSFVNSYLDLRLFDETDYETVVQAKNGTVSSILAAPILPSYLPKQLETVGYNVKEGAENAYFIFYDNGTLQYNSYFAEVKNLVGSDCVLASFNFLEFYGGSFSDDTEYFLSKSVSVHIAGIYTTTDSGFSTPVPYLSVSNSFYQRIHDNFWESFLAWVSGTKTTSQDQTFGVPSGLGYAFYDGEGNELAPSSGLYDSFSKTEKVKSAGKFILSSAYTGKDIYYLTQGVKVPIPESDRYYFTPDPLSGRYAESCYYDTGACYAKALGEEIVSSYLFPSAAEAKDAYQEMTEAGRKTVYYGPTSTKITLRLRSLSELSVGLRIGLLFGLFGILLGTMFVMLIMRSILSKFYYRKDYDQMVLSYIGYSYKDMIIINLIQFLSIAIFTIALLYPLTICLWPEMNSIFLLFPHLILWAIPLSLLFAGFIALPSRKKGKQ
jgi:ABC-type lipoprotein export system ATPase subunit